ncbi:MAG: DUF1611 domain-containing protein [Haloferacaceae archaeon]
MPPLFAAGDRIAILAHDHFPDEAKTAVGVLRYGDVQVSAILDRDKAGDSVAEHAPDLPDAPIVGSFDEVPTDVDALVIGIAPFGGGFDERWRSDVRAALEAGCDVVSGLHDVLAEDEEFAALAARHGGTIHDVREPPADVPLGSGAAAAVDTPVVLTVGTDGGVGKMTTTVELVRAARRREIDAGFVPTGQTGIMIAGRGIAIDRVAADFVSGAVEQMILEAAPDHDVLFVEGQGSITHPAYSADTCGILHGAMPDKVVLVHDADRDALEGFESFAIPDPGTYVDLYESVAAPVHETEVAAGALDTSAAESDAAARDLLESYAGAIDAPATDVVRFSADEILDDVLA